MTKTWHHRLETVLPAWIGLVERFNLLIIIFIIGGAILSLNYTVKHLGMNTNTKDMLSPELEWRQLDDEHDKLFPQYTDNILVVIEAGTPDEAGDAASLLYQHLQKEQKFFSSVYYPAGLPFFKTSALLYLDVNELQDLADNLAVMQPFLARLTEDRSIRGLFNMLGDAVEAKLEGDDIDLASLPQQINDALIAVDNDRHYRLSWQNLMGTIVSPEKTTYREFIILQPVLDYGGLLPARPALDRLRKLSAELNLTAVNNIRVRLTGSAALSYEEMHSVSTGMGISVLIAFILVTIILLIGLQSPWMVLASLITLLTGLVYTAGFAAAAIGTLNLISVAFAVLYIGLGVDFAIHFCLRYRELFLQTHDNDIALRTTVIHIGESLLLCAGTTAIGFFAFIPTDYNGVAELGLISGTGMFISFIITITLLPALLSLFPAKFNKGSVNGMIKKMLDHLAGMPVKHSGKIIAITVILAVLSLFAITQLRFDHNTLNLQPQKNESVSTYLDLLADSYTSPWTGIVLADSRDKSGAMEQALDRLPVVEKVVWLDKFIPVDQDEKLIIIEQMDLLLGSLTNESVMPGPGLREQIDAIKSFNQQLAALIATGQADSSLQSLHQTINGFLAELTTRTVDEQQQQLRQLEQSLLATLPGRIDALVQSMNAVTITENSLPQVLKSHWYSHGRYRMEIYPMENLNDNRAIRKFVDEVRTVVPHVTGSPVINIEAGDSVVTAFKQAFCYALGTIVILLLLLLEKKRDTVYLLVPLLLAALFTGAVSVLLDIPLNFANVIALPLLMGIGVDSGIHILHRLRSAPPGDGRILATSSARAVVISALTTILSIGNLAFSPHPGTASMGILLTTGISMTLICSLIVLPSLLVHQTDKT